MLPLLALLLASAAEDPAKGGGFWPAPTPPGTGTPPSTSSPATTSPAPPASTPSEPPTPPPAAPPGGGVWPAPPPAAPPAPPQGKPVTMLCGLVLGATDQVQPNVNGLWAGELGFLVDGGRLRVGALASLGERRDAGAWSLALLLGHGFRKPGRTNVDLLGELGLQGFWQEDVERLLSNRTISGGSAALPYLGLRLLLGAGTEPGGAAVSVFLQQTLGSRSASYRVTDCGLFNPCVTTTQVVRYGGFAAGIAIDLAYVVRTTAERPTSAPEEASPTAANWQERRPGP